MSGTNPTSSAEWTLLVYLAGDNNLTSEMVWGLQELKKASTTLKLGKKRINVVAHFDPGGLRSRRYDIVHANGKGGKPGVDGAQDGNLEPTVVFTQPLIESEIQGNKALKGLGGPGRTLAAFVLSQMAQFAGSKRFLLVLSGHGNGAEGDFLTDLDPTTSLSIPEIRVILNEARRAHYERPLSEDQRKAHPWKDDNDLRIDVLGMDSCLMSNVEVCYEIRDAVDYLVASEGFVENTGWPYHRVAEAFLDKSLPKHPAQQAHLAVAKQVASSYADFYQDYEISGVSTDIAVCALAAFRPPHGLVEKLAELAKILIPRLEASHARRLVRFAFGADPRAWDQRRKEAEAARDQLARDIAVRLREPDVFAWLADGSAKAKDMLANPDSWKAEGTEEEPASAKIALMELMQSRNPSYRQVDGQKEMLLRDLLLNLQGRVPASKDVEDPALALAIVRAIRELDPGVQKTLALIERADAQGSPEAKEARELLLQFHYIQQTLELAEYDVFRTQPQPDDRQLLDSLGAARWEAQSFKGGLYVDLFDFCGRIAEKHIPEIPGLDDVTQAIRSAAPSVVKACHTTGADFQHAHGLSVYFPAAAEDYTPKYMNLQFAKEAGWGRLVRAYLEATRRPRRDEDTRWFENVPIRRYNFSESDPLHREGIEARIIGIDDGAAPSGTAAKTGKGGNSNNAKGGNSNSAKGKLAAVFGNPPDGFRRPGPPAQGESPDPMKGTEA